MYVITEGGGNIRAYDETKSKSRYTYSCFNLLGIARLSKSDDNHPDTSSGRQLPLNAFKFLICDGKWG